MNTSGWTVTSAPNLGREVTCEITPREVMSEIPLRVAGTTVGQTLMLSPASRMETHLYIQKDDN